MMIPFQYRSRQVDSIMFRNVSTQPAVFRMEVHSNDARFETQPTERVIVSYLIISEPELYVVRGHRLLVLVQ
jgi:hypothetical protein